MYPMVSWGLTWAVLSVSLRNLSLTTMFRWEEEDSPPPSPSTPPPLLLSASALPSSSSFACWLEAVLGGTSAWELSLTELLEEEEEEEGAVSADDKRLSCWAGLFPSEGVGDVAETNRCSGGSEVRVEIHASRRTRSSSRIPNSSVTSSPTPSIRAIGHDNTGTHTTRHMWAETSLVSLNSGCHNKTLVAERRHQSPRLFNKFQKRTKKFRLWQQRYVNVSVW